MQTLSPHLLQLPTIGAKIVLTPFSYLAESRTIQYGTVWIIRSFEVYNPFRSSSNDPYYHLIGLPCLSISPEIDLPQKRRIGFPIDRDFTWDYLQNTVRTL